MMRPNTAPKSRLPLLLMLLLCCCAVFCCAHAESGQLVLPKNTKAIQAETFYKDTSLDEVVLPESIQTIGERAFASSGVTKVNLPETLTYIAEDAFANVKHVYAYGEHGSYAETWAEDKTNVTFVRRLTDTINWSFKDGVLNVTGTGIIPDYEYPVSGDAPWTKYRDNVQRIVIGEGITKIGNYNFKSCANNTEIVFPTTLTYIGGGAFAFNTSIEQVILPDSITSTSWDIFIGCSSLKYVKLPSKLTRLNTHVFSGTALETIVIPDTVTSIGHHAFYNCKNFTTVYLSSNVTRIGTDAFAGCPNLTIQVIAGSTANTYAAQNNIPFKTVATTASSFYYTSLPNTIGQREYYITGYKGNSRSIVIPNTINNNRVIQISNGAFKNITGITDVFIPNNILHIEQSAFYNCSGLTNVTLPKNIYTIGEYAFSGCSSLISLSGLNVGNIEEYAFSFCSKLKQIHLLTTTKIFSGAFSDCKNLTNATFGHVGTIETGAFYDCDNLTVLTIQTATSIKSRAFNDCDNLTAAFIGEVSYIHPEAFINCPKITLYGKAGSYVEAFAERNNIPFKVYNPNHAGGSLPTEYYKAIQAFSCLGETYYEAALVKDYNGVAAGTEYDGRHFFMNSKGEVVTNTATLCKLFTLSQYADLESKQHKRMNEWRSTAIGCGKTARDFLDAQALSKVLGQAAGSAAASYLNMLITGNPLALKDLAEIIISIPTSEAAIGVMAEVSYIDMLLNHLSSSVDDAVAYSARNENGMYEYQRVEEALAWYRYNAALYEAAQGWSIPIVNHILKNYSSDWELGLSRFGEIWLALSESALENLSMSTIHTKFEKWANATNNATQALDRLLSVVTHERVQYGVSFFTNSLSVLVDCFGMDPVGISNITESYYMTVEEMQASQMYYNHLLLAQ